MTRAGVISRVAGSVHRSVRSGRSVEVESVSASERAAGAEGREMDTSGSRREEDVRLRIVSGNGRGLRICSVPQVVVPGRRREGGGRGLVHTLTHGTPMPRRQPFSNARRESKPQAWARTRSPQDWRYKRLKDSLLPLLFKKYKEYEMMMIVLVCMCRGKK